MSSNGASGCTLFVDGLLAGRWSHDGSRFDLEVFRPLTRSERRGLEAGQERVAGLLARLTQRATRLAITRSGFRVRFVRE